MNLSRTLSEGIEMIFKISHGFTLPLIANQTDILGKHFPDWPAEGEDRTSQAWEEGAAP